MIRVSRLLFALAIASAFGSAHAQYNYPYGAGYGGYGFGGWGATPQGSMAAGMGVFAAGAGQYNAQTAQARSINANTAMQWNSYWDAAQASVNQSHYQRMQRERAQNIQATDAIQDRLRNNPNEVDIDRGDALNAVLQQLTDSRVLAGSGLARADAPLSARTIKGIPFRYAPEMAVICIDRLKNDIPDLLMSNELKTEREAFVAAVKKAVAEIKAGNEVSAQDVEQVRSTGRALYSKVETGLPDATAAERSEAITYLRNLKAFLKMLKTPEFQFALKDLDNYKSTTVGHLLAFMHSFNLRFGPAKTQEEVAVYRNLYPVLRGARDKIYASQGQGPAASSPPPPPPSPGAIFQGIEDKHLGDSGRGR